MQIRHIALAHPIIKCDPKRQARNSSSSAKENAQPRPRAQQRQNKFHILSMFHAALYEQKAHLSSSADARSSGRECGCCSTASAKGADSQPASSSTARP